MAIQDQYRRGTAAQHTTFTGAEGEVTVDTTNDALVVHDGTTVGGFRVAKLTELATKADVSHTHTVANISDYTESTQDLVYGMLDGTHINASVAYNDTTGKITITASGGGGPVSEQDTYLVDAYGGDPTGVADSTSAIRSAMAAAAANVTATGRKSAIKFSAGKYKMTTRTVAAHIDVTGMHDLVFLGADGRRTTLILEGNAGSADWYMFHVRGASYNIFFEDLVLKMGTITSPDPAEQHHLIQVSGGCENVLAINCEFADCVGDGIRILGDFGITTSRVGALDCDFNDCGRSGFGFQRWSTRCLIVGNRFNGGGDQPIDFEPTGYTLTADAGGSGTSLVDASSSFITWGIVPGDLVYHVGDEAAYVITAVTATTLTIAAGASTWASATYYFPKHNAHHVIANNHMYRTDADAATAGSIMLSIAGTYGSVITGNVIENGTIKTADLFNCTVSNNTITAPLTAAGDAALEIIKAQDGTRYIGNTVRSRTTDTVTGRDGIKCVLVTRGPGNASIIGNSVMMDGLGNGIRVEASKGCLVQGNTVWSAREPGSVDSSGIDIRTAGITCESVQVLDNRIYTVPGGRAWYYGIRVQATNSTNIESANVSNNSITNAAEGVYFTTASGGLITAPPIVIGNIFKDITYSPAPNAQCPIFQVGGSGGVDRGSFGMFYGIGSPEGVLYAAKGSIYTTTNAAFGSVSTSYMKSTADTLNTGWVSMNYGSPGGAEWGRIKRAAWSPAGASTAATAFGLNAFQVTGTATSRTSAFTSIAARQTRLGAVSSAVAGSLCGIRHTIGFVSLGSGSYGGFRFVGGHMNTDAATVANARGFYGLWSSVGAPTNIDPATMTNCIGIAQLTSSANLHLVYGGSSAQTPIDLGANFPAGTLSTDYYILELYASPLVDNSVYYRVERLNTGHVATGTLTGTAGTALPSSSTGLTVNCWRTNNTDALAVAVDYGQIVIDQYE